MEPFKKIPSSFGALVRKPGLAVNYPPPHLQHEGYRLRYGYCLIIIRFISGTKPIANT